MMQNSQRTSNFKLGIASPEVEQAVIARLDAREDPGLDSLGFGHLRQKP